MKFLAGGSPDQYYAVTSRLTARGYQQTVMRVVAACVLMLGLPPALAATNPSSSRWSAGWMVFGATAVAVVGMAIPWLRYRWPSRSVSTTIVVLGAVVLGLGCSLAADPLAGLIISTAFAFVLGYAALFHGERVQIAVACLSAATVLALGYRIAARDLATAFAVVTPVLMVNLAVTWGCRVIAGVMAVSESRTDIEPLTGLLTRSGFDEMAGNLLGARHRDDDRYLVVALVSLDSFAPLRSLQGTRATDRARIAAAQALRETVRRDALVGHIGDAEFLVADTFTTADPTPLAERIRGAVAATPQGITASIGVVCTPLSPLADRPPHDVLDEVVALATTAMYHARRRGGNQAEYVIDRAGL